MTKSMFQVLLADDHQVMTSGLANIIAELPDFNIVAQCQSAEQALELLKTTDIQIVVTDLYFDDQQPAGIELTEGIKKNYPHIKVLMYSGEVINAYMLQKVYHAGIDAYVPKNTSINELKEALNYLSKGKSYFNHDILQKIAEASREKIEKLTSAEQRLLELIGKGYSRQDICEKALKISENTYDTHLQHIKAKLDVKTMPELIQKALRLGLIPPSEL